MYRFPVVKYLSTVLCIDDDAEKTEEANGGGGGGEYNEKLQER